MEDVARIVLAVESEHLAHDVIDYLDRTGRTRVVDTVRDPNALAAAVELQCPDVVVGSPAVLRSAERLNGSKLLAVATEESVRVLRDAISVGARGFFLWPSDRDALGAAAALTAVPREDTRRARIVGVYGPRGGVGATFVASHLAAAMAGRAKETILVDMDQTFADVTWAIGVTPEADVRTVADLEPVHEEISEDHLRSVLWTHPSGLQAVLAPPRPDPAAQPDRCRHVLGAAARACDIVVAHLPRGLDASVGAVMEAIDVLLVVVGLDVLSFRDAKRIIDEFDASLRWEIVVNRAARSVIVPRDVERVFGRAAFSIVPFDRRVVTAQNRGELVASRTRAGRSIARLCSALLEEWA